MTCTRRKHKTYVRAVATATSHPTWLVRRWLASFGHEDTVELCAHNNSFPTYCLRVNTTRTTVAAVERTLLDLGAGVEVSKLMPTHFLRCAAGLQLARAGVLHLHTAQLCPYRGFNIYAQTQVCLEPQIIV